jgi:hypothetical protein
MWLESYWELFARHTFEADGLRLLQNPNLPILEVNAGYGVPLDLLEQHCSKLKRPCLLVSDQPTAKVLHHLKRLEWRSNASASVFIEQVPWTQASLLAQAWCEQHRARSWHDLVTLELGRVLQETPDLCAYVALDGNTPVGMALVMPNNGWWHNGTAKEWFSVQPQGASCAWWAGERQVARALFARASSDFAGLEVVLPANWGFDGTDVYISHVSDGRIA